MRCAPGRWRRRCTCNDIEDMMATESLSREEAEQRFLGEQTARRTIYHCGRRGRHDPLSVRAGKPRHHRRGAADRRRVVHQLSAQPLSTELARWAASVTFEDLPEDVVAATKLRVMDVIGLALAGRRNRFWPFCSRRRAGDFDRPGRAAFSASAIAWALQRPHSPTELSRRRSNSTTRITNPSFT